MPPDIRANGVLPLGVNVTEIESRKLGHHRIHIVLVVLRLDVGGMERYVANVANGLSRDTFRVSILCFDQMGSAQDWITRDDVEIVELGFKKGNSWQAVKSITNALKKLNPNVVHSHNWATLVETYLAIRRYGSAVHLHGERGTVLGTNTCGPIKRAMRATVMRWICRRIELTTNSDCVAEKVSAITGIDRAKIHIVANGLDPKYTLEELKKLRGITRDELGLMDDDYVIGTVARLSPIKNLGLAIRALADAQKSLIRNAHLVLVGDGPCRSDLESLASSLGVSTFVQFVGHQSNPWRYMAAMDVFVNCSDSEGMSQSMLEGMASGLPIIATDVGDAGVMVGPPDPCGIIITPNNTGELVRALTEMTEVKQRKIFAAAALNQQRTQYSLASMIQGYENLYQDLVTSPISTS